MFPYQLVGSRYRIEKQIGHGGMGEVYRASDRLTGQTIAIKCVLAQATQLQFASHTPGSNTDDALLALAAEFRTLAGLRHPHIVAVLDYGFDSTPYFTMQLITQARTITEYAKTEDTAGKVRLLVEMLQALAYLHRRGIIHRDLKPGNVLVTKEGVVKVMDFGLALHQTPSISNVYPSAVGTIAYMAPELLGDTPASVPSDLYAVGVIAYEMFVGKHPFHSPNVAQMITSIVSNPVDTSMLDAPLGAVLQRLLHKSPLHRYDSADAVIEALCRATGQPIPQEDAAMRESFLQAAKFVGRDTELATLTQSLEQVNQSGSAWLIGGESGVGKSRLMDELRTRALVSGVLVLRGQAVAGGGLPYQLWRDPIRRLVLSVKLSELEISLLKELVPDIGDLLRRRVQDAAETDAKSRQRLLKLTIVDVIRRFCSGGTGLVLLVEDLHWAMESLEPLKALIQVAPELPLLMVGSYRDDEKPDLPQLLPEIEVLKLARLNDAAIMELSAAMLGDTGRQPHVVDMLKRETEGNAFFMVEVVRALAETSGRMQDIAYMTLPTHLITGGVQQVVRRRLERVPGAMRPLLRLAAVAGRQLDLTVIERLATHNSFTVESWLTTCAAAAVLEVIDGGWRFSHDKIREAVLLDLSDEAHAALNQQVAETLETVYPEDEAYAEPLLEHWRHAGDLLKQLHYAQLVTRTTLHTTANYPYASVILERLLPALETLPDVQQQKMKLLKTLGDVYHALSEYPAARQNYEQSLQLAESLNDDLGRAAALRGIADTAYREYRIPEATETMLRSLELYQKFGTPREIASCFGALGMFALETVDYDAAYQYAMQSYEIRKTLPYKWDISASLNSLGNIAYFQNDPEKAIDYYEQGLAIKREIGDRWGTAAVLNNLGVLAHWKGDYPKAVEYYEGSLSVFQDIGDRYGVGINLYNLGNCAYFLEDHFGAYDYHKRSLATFQQINDPWGICSSLVSLAYSNIVLMDLDGAQEQLADALKVAHEVESIPLQLHAVLGYAQLRLAEGDTLESARIFSLVVAHPSLEHDTAEMRAEPLRTALEAVLSPEAMTQAAEHAKTLTLSALVETLLKPAQTV